jgi:hypothetical protein
MTVLFVVAGPVTRKIKGGLKRILRASAPNI